MFFRVKDTYYNIEEVSYISTFNRNFLKNYSTRDGMSFVEVQIWFLRHSDHKYLKFFTEIFSVGQLMYDYQRNKTNVYEFIVYTVEDMKNETIKNEMRERAILEEAIKEE